MIGLRGYKKHVKGSGIRYKLSALRRELNWAWQRAWRGYDDGMWFSLDYHFIKTYKLLLKELRQNLHGYPHGMTMEEWENILEVMAGLLEIMDEGINSDYEQMGKAKNEFFKLFSKYFYDLWD